MLEKWLWNLYKKVIVKLRFFCYYVGVKKRNFQWKERSEPSGNGRTKAFNIRSAEGYADGTEKWMRYDG